MAGWKQDPKETIKEAFGEDVDAVKAKLAKLEALEMSINEIKASVATQATGFDEVKNMIKDLKSPYDQPKPDDKPIEEEVDWGIDAQKKFNKEITPLTNIMLDTRAMIAKREVMDKVNKLYPDLPWHLFDDEINKMVEKEPLSSRANPMLWENVYYIVKGKHYDDIARDKNQKEGKFFVESGTSSIKIEPEKKSPVDELSDREKEVAKKFGISAEIYAKEKASMVIGS